MLDAVCGICKEKTNDFVIICNKEFHETCLDLLLTNVSSCSSCKNALTCNPRIERFLTGFTGTEEQLNKLDEEFILTLFVSKYFDYPVERVLNRFLVLKGDINTTNSNKASLLHLAAENSNEEFVKALLKSGAKIDLWMKKEELLSIFLARI